MYDCYTTILRKHELEKLSETARPNGALPSTVGDPVIRRLTLAGLAEDVTGWLANGYAGRRIYVTDLGRAALKLYGYLARPALNLKMEISS